MNVLSEEKNINYFFEDAKLIFKNMKEKRQELVMRLKKDLNLPGKTIFLLFSVIQIIILKLFFKKQIMI
jgi:hypothetical protein